MNNDLGQKSNLDLLQKLPAAAVYIIDQKIHLNSAAEKLTGYKTEDFKGLMQWFQKAYPENTNEVIAMYQSDKQQGFAMPRVVPFRTKIGTQKFIQFSAYQDGQYEIWILHDVTELKASGEKLDRSFRQMKMFVENMPTAVTMLDREYRILTASNMWYKVHKKNPEEVVGQIIFDAFWTDDYWKIIYQRAMAGEAQRKDEDSLLRNGKQTWFKWEIRPWYDEDKIGGVIAYSEDMTEFRQNQEKLIQASKLASLGEMSSSIAHEINNPLSIIVARARQLRDKLVNDQIGKEEVLQVLEKINQTSLRITKIISGLRDFSRDSESDPFVVVSLGQIIDETLELCRARLQNHSINLFVDEVDAGLKIYCRPTQIEQVLLNLINNSFDAIAACKDGWVQISTREDFSFVEISVTDSGLGISAKNKDKIFMPFFTTKDVGKGTGLGLSVSKGIIHGHKGELLLDSENPHTCFVIRLPKA